MRLLTKSRVQPTRALAAAAALVRPPPAVWLQMSTLAIYGDAGETVLDESAPPADGPPQMAGVARAWEQAALAAAWPPAWLAVNASTRSSRPSTCARVTPLVAGSSQSRSSPALSSARMSRRALAGPVSLQAISAR